MDLQLHRLSFRPATAADEAFARDVHHACYRDVVIRQFGGWDEVRQSEFFAHDWTVPGMVILYCDTARAGYAHWEQTANAVVLHELVLSQAFQGVGLGTELLRALQQAAASRGLPVVLGVLRESYAVALYSRLGFERVGANENHLAMRWKSSRRAGGCA